MCRWIKNNVSQTRKLWLSYTIGQFNMSAYRVSSNSVMGFKSGEAVRETKSKGRWGTLIEKFDFLSALLFLSWLHLHRELRLAFSFRSLRRSFSSENEDCEAILFSGVAGLVWPRVRDERCIQKLYRICGRRGHFLPTTFSTQCFQTFRLFIQLLRTCQPTTSF